MTTENFIRGILFLFIFSVFSNLLHGQCNLTLSAGDDVYLCPDESGQLNGSISGDYDFYEWTPENGLSDPTILDPEVDQPGIYTLRAEYNTMNNIIVNGDFSQGVSSFTSDYTHATAANGACISPWGPLGCEGTFDVLTNPQIGHTSFAACSDQSGDGNMLVVNGAGMPNQRVWCQNVTVNPGSDYIFSAWVTSVVAASPAILQFRINGTLLGNTFSPTGAVCNWSEHTADWSAGGTSAAQICLINQNTTLGGNDFAVDNIQFTEICVEEDEVEVFAVELEFIPTQVEPINCTRTSVELEVTNVAGTGPNYFGQWTDPNGFDIGPAYPPNYSINVSEPGFYTFTYTFFNGDTECTKFEIVEVPDERVEIDAEAEVEGFLGCGGGTALARAIGSSFDGPYDFHWYTDNGNILSDPSFSEIEVDEIGIYNLVVFDPNSGCADTTSVEVFSDNEIPNAIIDFPEILNCQNPIVTLDAFGSNLPGGTFITWSTTDGHFVDGTDDLEPRVDSAGNYILILTNPDNGCMDTAEVMVESNFNYPLIDLGNSDTLTCHIESFFINAGPSQTGVQYSWTTPQGTITDTTGVNATQEGLYVLEAYDPQSECISIDSVEIYSNQNYPSGNVLNPDQLDCNTDSIEISVENIISSGSTSVEWLNGNGIDLSSGDSSVFIHSPGWYFLNITDLTSDCTFRDSILVEIDTISPDFNIGDSLLFTCSDTSVSLSGTALGVGNYYPIWYDNAGNVIEDNAWNTQVRSSGTYVLEVINQDNGCISSLEQVVYPDQNLPSLVLSPVDTLNCSRNFVDIISTGSASGNGNILYEWEDASGNIISDSSVISVNQPGNYTVTILDESNDCSVSQSVSVQIDTISPLASFAELDTLNCQDTTAIITVDMFDPSLNYNWSTSEGIIDSFFNNGASIISSSEGTYLLNVVDPENGCQNQYSVELTGNYDYPLVDFSEPPTLTCDQDTAVISALISNSSNTSILWSGPSSGIIGSNDNSIVLVNAAGFYAIEVMNEDNGCMVMDSVQVLENRDTIPYDIDYPEEINCNNEESVMSLNFSTSLNYEVTWSNSDGTVIASNSDQLSANAGGTYSYSVLNLANGCLSDGIIEVAENSARPEALQYLSENAICQEEFGSIQITDITGGTAPYQILVDGQPVNLNDLQQITTGNHEIRIIDDRGCELTEEVRIDREGGFSFFLIPEHEIEWGDSVQLSPIFTDPNIVIDSIHWSNITGFNCDNCLEPWASPTQEQAYGLEVFDINGCSFKSDTRIRVVFEPEVFIPNSFSPNADGNNDFFFVYSQDKWVNHIHEMRIYDRWGNEILFNKDLRINIPQDGWDGKYKGEELNPAVFIYYVDVELRNGVRRIYSGDVTLFK